MFTDKDIIYRIPESGGGKKARGGFGKRIVILLLDEPDFPESDTFLQKIFTAAQINLEKDVLLVMADASGPMHFLPIVKDKHPERLLVFGFMPDTLGLHAEIPLYQPVVFYGVEFLFAEALSVLAPDKNRKSRLWQALQQLFL